MRPLGVVEVVYGTDGDAAARSRLAAADGFAHIDVMVDVDPATLALPVGCPTAFPKPQPGLVRDAGAGGGRRHVGALRPVVPGRARRAAGAVGGRGVNSRETCRGDARGGARSPAAGRHRPRGRLGRRSARAAGARRPRAAAAGRARLDAAPRRRSGRRRRLPRRARRASTPSGTTASLSVEYFDLPDAGLAAGRPARWACDLARVVTAGS